MKDNYKPLGFSIGALVLSLFFILTLNDCKHDNDTNDASTESPLPDGHSQDILIPEQSEWTDYGFIIEKGEAGDWDFYLSGGFTGTVVKKNSVFYLYYQGAEDYSNQYGTVTYRAIGVATSPDGVNFSKYGNNPVITWFPNNGIEEGAVSAGATLLSMDEIVMYYGANTAISETLVNADGRLAVSTDGLNFNDLGVVLDHEDSLIWGHGDELFPIIAFYDNNNRYVYYIPNGTPQSRKLAVAWGPGINNLTNSEPVISEGETVDVWGMGGSAKVGDNTYALFINDVTQSRMEVRGVHLDAPDQLSGPLRIYEFENFAQGTVFLDYESETWFMFYLSEPQDNYHVKVASVRYIEDQK
jgi:hypothetical protein